MTIDEAIEIYEKRAKSIEMSYARDAWADGGHKTSLMAVAADYKQLAEWLRELKEIKNQIDSGDLSDGYHTFNQLYHQRAMLFATIVNQNSDKAWKTHKHEDGEPCFGGGWFLVTIDTPKGAYGYHYEDKYWDLFKCKELEIAKHWDGYTEEDVGRLFSLC